MVTLTKEQIRSLYGVTSTKGEVVAFGRAIKHSVPASRLRKLKLDDFEIGSPERIALQDRIYRLKSKPAATVLESEVQELTL
jgi:hypothetical protein